MCDLMGKDAEKIPKAIKGAALSCIPSDALEFRSPTTIDHDCDIADKLASELGVNIPSYANEMFEAKSDISAFSDAELLRMDSKKYAIVHTKFRVSVLETTAPKLVLDRKYSLMTSMRDVAIQDGVDQALLFVIDILREEAAFFVPNDLVKTIAQNSFGVDVSGDTVVLPGVMSRKKQIIPPLIYFSTMLLIWRLD
jgi:manganese-dependent inorganic pyrophosphatase